MAAPTPDSGPAIGRETPRIDGRAKVTGQARYPSDEQVGSPAWAYLVTSAIARGEIAGFDLEAANNVPGVLDILTHQNVGKDASPPEPPGGKGKSTTTTMESSRIWHDGQIIAVVVADTFEAAREAAQKVGVDYREQTPSASFDSDGVEVVAVKDVDETHHDPAVGDADAAFAAADVRIEADYETPTQHHNPLELFTTTCEWTGGRLVIREPSQFVHGLRAGVATQLDMDREDVRVLSRFIGGAFGSKGGPTSRTAWIAVAARRLGRPVKLVATREQGFTIATYRAETRHHIRLAADRSGKLQALVHEGQEVTSRPSFYNVGGTATTASLYACPNVRTRVDVVHADRNTPGFMRAPPETPYMFPLESAMDELAHALAIDPVELRRVNDTMTDPITGAPYTSRSLMRCFDEAAARFRWSERDLKPASMRKGDWLIGMGCATACYPVNIGAAAARVTLLPNGARVELGAQDLGTGAYTVLAITAADRLGLPVGSIAVEIGDSDLPAAGLAAGSNHTASICNVVAKACDEIRDRLAAAAVRSNEGLLAGRDASTLALRDGLLVGTDGVGESVAEAAARLGGRVEVYAENLPRGVPANGMRMVYEGKMASARGSEMKDEKRYSFGAQFVEVGVHAMTREVRVRRAVGAFAAGTIVNPTTAHSQLMGGMIWGIGSALHEKTEIDERAARYVNDNLADYLVAVNADVPDVDVILVPEVDHRINPLGIKGVGELGIVGMNAAIANAVFHATGTRIRKLPIRIEDLLS